jgi:protein-disulfide isomerase
LVALVMLGVFLFDQQDTTARTTSLLVDDWEAEARQGIMMGPMEAPVVVVAFMDFQCPYCARLATRLDSLSQEYPGKIQVAMHHFPLTSHTLALPAAIAAECAERQGRFGDFVRAVFRRQAELNEGVVDWSSVASEAGVPQLRIFEECAQMPVDSFPRIAYGQELGARTGVAGTPTVWVNGYREMSPPTLQRLRVLVEDVLDQG